VPAWELYSVVVRRRPKAIPPLALLLATIIFGFPILIPFYAWELVSGASFSFSIETALAIGYVGSFASVLAFICWNHGVARVGANKTGLFIHMLPVFAALLALIFLGERLEPFHAAGIAFVAAGLYLSSTARGG
jgi:drug/metabolite transporter (DMT)-like permease